MATRLDVLAVAHPEHPVALAGFVLDPKVVTDDVHLSIAFPPFAKDRLRHIACDRSRSVDAARPDGVRQHIGQAGEIRSGLFQRELAICRASNGSTITAVSDRISMPKPGKMASIFLQSSRASR
jgi:hypothetical protein